MASVYVHIPFCRQICYYCDYHARASLKNKDAMLAAMKKEFSSLKFKVQSLKFKVQSLKFIENLKPETSNLKPETLNFKPETSNLKPETLYFGGGTPSVLSIDELKGLLDAIIQHYEVSSDTEITIEANPEDLTDDYLAGLRQLGFNRLSIGVQSFFDDDLLWMNRRHSAAEARKSVENAKKYGFHNINVDLIYGLPTMTAERWKTNLYQALDLDVPHLSAYHLIIETRSVFGKRQEKGKSFSISEDDSAEQFFTLLDMTEKAGYEHYEISNFARPGFHSRHNTACWQGLPYIGIGPSAHSYDGQSRRWNISNNSEYIIALEQDLQWFDSERLTTDDKYNEYVLMSLRAAWGADINHIRVHFGSEYANEFLRQAAVYMQNGYIQQRGDIFTITRKGKMIADRIASDLFC